jgi:hypothetical protein
MSVIGDLHVYWQNIPGGVGVRMIDMLDATGAADPQQIRAVLTRLRKGYQDFPPLAVRYNPADGRYYDMARLNADAIEQHVAGNIFVSQVTNLLTRAMTLRFAIGGVVDAAALLQHDEIRVLLAQLPVEIVYQVEDTWREIGRARNQLLLGPGNADEER